ncbi:tubulin polyglutamylase complex subunit 2-like isoform X2 [Monodelphis domestica]|uniref:tubulin polyglutamylase complex subunit 2-like isoform X2 n=1 Tax=Monodelphis domestica TaxID=13616 RepID=UPI0024E1D9D6|nr:tubulin polyglutamylase complex subunit 2-like isoform X2 [Monodelphis domestica]
MEEKVPSPLVNTKPHLEKLTLGITRILEASPGVTKVQIIEKEPAERHMIASWELKNDCAMPEDLKNFYLMTNGFHMVWSVKLDDQPVPLGSLVINSISNLTQLTQSAVYTLPNSPTLEDLEDEEDEANEDRPEKPHFDARSVIFELDSCNGNGKVCLVYRRTQVLQCALSTVAKESKIWFLDRALYWHFLTDNFTSYYRLLITHMGLPQWQYAFTNYGVSPQAKWFNMYKPITYNTAVLAEESDCFINKLDPSKVFKSKAKPAAPSQRGGTPHPPGSQKGSSSSSSTKPSSGNPARK